MNILATLGLMLCDASTSASVKIIICFFVAGAGLDKGRFMQSFSLADLSLFSEAYHKSALR